MNCNAHLFDGLSYETRMMLNRRQFFGRGGSIVGAAALGSLLGSQPAQAGATGLALLLGVPMVLLQVLQLVFDIVF